MTQHAHITGKVEYREGDGPNIRIRPGPCEITETALDVTISWTAGETHGAAAMPVANFRRYLARRAALHGGGPGAAARLRRMRRWLAIFLLCLLPLQTSWAAVAVYCGHEADAQASHPGHHDHQHAGQPDEAPQAGKSTAAGVDIDCGHCHGSCASLTDAAEHPAPLVRGMQPVATLEGRLRTLAPSPPERPQWACPA